MISDERHRQQLSIQLYGLQSTASTSSDHLPTQQKYLPARYFDRPSSHLHLIQNDTHTGAVITRSSDNPIEKQRHQQLFQSPTPHLPMSIHKDAHGPAHLPSRNRAFLNATPQILARSSGVEFNTPLSTHRMPLSTRHPDHSLVCTVETQDSKQISDARSVRAALEESAAHLQKVLEMTKISSNRAHPYI